MADITLNAILEVEGPVDANGVLVAGEISFESGDLSDESQDNYNNPDESHDEDHSDDADYDEDDNS